MFYREEFEIALIKNKTNQQKLAKEYGCSSKFFNLFINGKKKSKPLEKFISEKLNILPMQDDKNNSSREIA